MNREQSGRRAAHRGRRAVLAMTLSAATAAAVGVALPAPGSGSATPAPAGLRIAGASLGGLVPAIPPTPRSTPDGVSAPSPSPAALTADAPPPAVP
jgi:hypothetical protein